MGSEFTRTTWLRPFALPVSALRETSGGATMTIEALVGFGYPILPRPGFFLCTLGPRACKTVHKKHNTQRYGIPYWSASPHRGGPYRDGYGTEEGVRGSKCVPNGVVVGLSRTGESHAQLSSPSDHRVGKRSPTRSYLEFLQLWCLSPPVHFLWNCLSLPCQGGPSANAAPAPPKVIAAAVRALAINKTMRRLIGFSPPFPFLQSESCPPLLK